MRHIDQVAAATLLAEVEQICTHAAVMSAGRLVAQGTLDELRSGRARLVVHTPDVVSTRQVLISLGIEPDSASDGVVSAPLPDYRGEPESIVAALVAAGIRVRGFTVESATLEDRFVALTGEGFNVVQ